MHEQEAAAHGLRCEYRLIDVEDRQTTGASLRELLETAERKGFAGLNVTHPFKLSVVPLLHELSRESRVLGAVNTIVFRHGLRVGHNTDWCAFRESFRETLPDAALNRVVQLGAGGAGAATAYAALEMGAAHVTVIDAAPDRARELASRLAESFPASRIEASDDLSSGLAQATGLIHATPTGMASHPGSAVPASLLRPDVWVADVVYFPIETELLRAARAIGCRTMNGGGMAVYQAAEAFRLFTGRRADVKRMRQFFDQADPAA